VLPPSSDWRPQISKLLIKMVKFELIFIQGTNQCQVHPTTYTTQSQYHDL